MRLYKKNSAAFTLLEILITLALLVFLAALFFPSSKGLGRATTLSGTDTLLLTSFEQARLAAIQEHAETWVIFQHREPSASDRFCTLQETEDKTMKLLMPWTSLPPGVSFEGDSKSIPITALSEKIRTFLMTLSQGSLQGDETLGGLHYNTQGAIVSSATGTQNLHLDLVTTTKQVIHDRISFSPLTGRACRKEN